MARRSAEARLKLMELRLRKLKKEMEVKKTRLELADMRAKIKNM